MVHLTVLGFDDRHDAQAVFELGGSLERADLLDLEDSALVWRDDKGRVQIQQSLSITRVESAAGASHGALWGTLLGLLVLNPVAGLAIGGMTGAAVGATAGAFGDIGINDDFMRRMGEQLQPGRAAVFALVRRSTPEKVAEALRQYRPTVLHTSLAKDREDDLIKALRP